MRYLSPLLSDARGKLGNTVFSRNPSGLYSRANTPPAQPRTVSQQTGRANFGTIAEAWRSNAGAPIVLGDATLTTNAVGANSYTQIYGNASFAVSGALTSVDVSFTTLAPDGVSTVTIQILDQLAGQYKLTDSFNVTPAATATVQTFTAGIDFAPRNVTAGQYLGFLSFGTINGSNYYGSGATPTILGLWPTIYTAPTSIDVETKVISATVNPGGVTTPRAAWAAYAAQKTRSDSLGNSYSPTGFHAFLTNSRYAQLLGSSSIPAPPAIPSPPPAVGFTFTAWIKLSTGALTIAAVPVPPFAFDVRTYIAQATPGLSPTINFVPRQTYRNIPGGWTRDTFIGYWHAEYSYLLVLPQPSVGQVIWIQLRAGNQFTGEVSLQTKQSTVVYSVP
jgi:hypothetical protein